MNAATKTGNANVIQRAATWHHIISKIDCPNYESLRGIFPDVDRVGTRLVFNLGSYRLITGYNFSSQTIFIKYLLTHDEYMRKDWQE